MRCGFIGEAAGRSGLCVLLVKLKKVVDIKVLIKRQELSIKRFFC